MKFIELDTYLYNYLHSKLSNGEWRIRRAGSGGELIKDGAESSGAWNARDDKGGCNY